MFRFRRKVRYLYFVFPLFLQKTLFQSGETIKMGKKLFHQTTNFESQNYSYG